MNVLDDEQGAAPLEEQAKTGLRGHCILAPKS